MIELETQLLIEMADNLQYKVPKRTMRLQNIFTIKTFFFVLVVNKKKITIKLRGFR